MLIKLSNANLSSLPPSVRVPSYDRRRVGQRITHIGVGGFHRAHQGVYNDDLFQKNGPSEWGLCGVGLLPVDTRIGEVLRSQDYLYTVVERSASGDKARVIGSIQNFLHAPSDPNAVLEKLASADTDEHRALVREQFGIEDSWPVMTESFRQWVIEDDFVQGRPAWEQAGAQFTSDVLPYEKMKLRLLNASHQAICYVGMLQGYEFAHEAMADPRITKLMRLMMDIEVTPLLPEVPGIDLDEYKNTLIERFANPAIRDQLGRLGTEGSARIPKFVLPSVTEQLQRGGPIKLLSLTVASWFRYLSGKDDTGKPVPMNDPMLDQLRDAANAGGKYPRRLLPMRQLFSEELASNQPFVRQLEEELARFYAKETAATLEEYLG